MIAVFVSTTVVGVAINKLKVCFDEALIYFRRIQLIFEVAVTGPPSVILCRTSSRDGRIGSRAALTVSNLRQYFRYTSILTPFCSQTIIGKKK